MSEKKHAKKFYRFVSENLSLIDFVIILAEDIAFFLFCTVVLILVNFKLYFGFFRWYSLLSAIVGFFLYRCTVGRIVISFSEIIVRFIVSLARFTADHTVIPVLGFIYRLLISLKEKNRLEKKIRYTRLYEKSVLCSIRFEEQANNFDNNTEVENNVKG